MENKPERFVHITKSDFFYQQAPCGFISFLPDGDFIRVNETFARWIGLTEEAICTMKFEHLLTDACSAHYDMIISPLLNSQGFTNEISLSFRHGRGYFDVLFSAMACKDEEGCIIGVNATIQNLSERRKYESELIRTQRYAEEEKRRFEFLSNSTPNLIWTALPDGKVNFINQQMKDYFGESNVDYITNFMGVIEEDREGIVNAWNRSLTTGRKLEKEVRLQANGRPPEWFLIRVVPYFNEEGHIELWSGSSTNINKQKLLQLANYSSLTDSLSMAHKTIDDNKEMFMQIAMNQSHMIRKPLANIIGLISLLNEVDLPEEGTELLELLNISAEELDKLIKEVVNSTRFSG